MLTLRIPVANRLPILNSRRPRRPIAILNMGWFIGIGIEIARIDDEVDSDSDSDSDFDALHEVAVDKLRIADNP